MGGSDRSSPKASGTGGYTLIDMILAMMILGIMLMFGVPQFQSVLTHTRLNEASADVVSALQYARNLAVKHQRPFGVAANAADNWFKVFDHQYKDDAATHHHDDPPVDAYGIVHHPVDKAWYLRDFDTRFNGNGLKMISVPPGGEVFFFPDGHSSELNHTFVIGCSGEQRTITINGTTGRISVQ